MTWFYCGLALLLVRLPRGSEAQIEGTNWFPVGPAPITGFFPGGVTGRASGLAVNPFNPEDVWIGTAAGGVWHTEDLGASWKAETDFSRYLAIGAVAVDDCDPDRCESIYAGTGEDAIRRDTQHGGGLLIGTYFSSAEFFGYSFELKDGGPTYDFKFGSIVDIALDYTTSGDDKHLYIALSSGKTASASGATVNAPEPSPGGYGIYESDDRGDTWTKLSVSGSDGARPTSLIMDPADPLVLYAAFMGRGVFKTDDGGANWCPLNDGISQPLGCTAPTTPLPDPADSPAFDFIRLAVAPSDSQILYASFGHCEDELLQNCRPTIYRSDNGGVDWEVRLTGSGVNGQITSNARIYSRYSHALAIDPSNPDIVYLGGGKIWRSTNGADLFVAHDDVDGSVSGTSPWGKVVHFDHRRIVVFPTDPMRLYDTSDGGFAYSLNGGDSWFPANDGLQISQFYTLATSPLTGRVIGGLQDNNGILWIGSASWVNTGCCADAGASVMDYDDVTKAYICSNYGDPRMNEGEDFSDWGEFNSGISSSEPRLFYGPMEQATTPPHDLYIGTNRLYQRSNGDATWTPISPSLSLEAVTDIVTESSSNAHIMNGAQDAITAIGIAPSNHNRIYVGFYSGKIFTTDSPCDSFDCWEDVSSDLPSDPVTSLAVHPTIPEEAFATFSGFDESSARVRKTENAGSSWASKANGLPPGVPVNVVRYEPSHPDRLWLGMDSTPDLKSLYKSTDSGDNWSAFGFGLPNALVYDIDVDEAHGRVYCTTHGRGVFVLGEPLVSNYEGWVDGQIWDVPVYGHNFPTSASCTMTLYQEDSTNCSSGSIDAKGGTIETDGDGVLGTSLDSFYSGTPVAWACFSGTCVGDVDIDDCNEEGNLLSTVVVVCDGAIGIDPILGCPLLDSPPSTLLGLGLSGFERRRSLTNGNIVSSLLVTASVQGRDSGGTQSLCTVKVVREAGQTVDQVVRGIRDRINDSPVCKDATVVAELDGDITEEGEEDEFPRELRLRLVASGVIGGQLVTSIRVLPPVGIGRTCHQIASLGVPLLNQIQIIHVGFDTLPDGASGGQITVYEETDLGMCAVTITTTAGQSADSIAEDIRDAFGATGIPGPHPLCPSRKNMRDVSLLGDGIIFVFARSVDVCIDDEGIGLSIRPEELLNVHPAADAGGPYQVECEGSTTSFALDGSGSVDPDDDNLSYSWSSTCPGATFDDASSATPQLTVSTVEPLPVDCTAKLTVTDPTPSNGVSLAAVSIVDTIPPVITTCAEHRELIVDESGFVQLGDLRPELLIQEQCGIASIVQNPPPFSSLAPGSYEVTFAVTDVGSHETSCVTQVRVLDIVLNEEEKVMVTFSRNTRLEARGLAEFREATATEVVEGSGGGGGETLPATVLAKVANVVIADLALELEVKRKDQSLWTASPSGPLRQLKFDWKDGTYDLQVHDGMLSGDMEPFEVHVEIHLGSGDVEHVMLVDVVEADWTLRNSKKWKL